jgi:hypothetical protein
VCDRDPAPISGVRVSDGFLHAEEAGAPASEEERIVFSRQRERLAGALETALKTWFGRTKRPSEAFEIARIFYESGDGPDLAFKELQKLQEFRRFLVTEALQALSERQTDGDLRLTLLGVAAWTDVHCRFMCEEGELSRAVFTRGFIPAQ